MLRHRMGFQADGLAYVIAPTRCYFYPMAPPPGGWRRQPWLTLLVLPALVILFGSSLRIDRPVGIDGAWIVTGSQSREIDLQRLAPSPEGSAPDRAIALGTGEALEVALGRPVAISGVEIQANHASRLRVLASPDRATWSPLWIAPPVDPPGLRTRRGSAPRGGAPARWLRVEPDVRRPAAIAALNVVAPRLAIPRWLIAPVAVWGLWLLLVVRGKRSATLLGRWVRWDLPIASLGVGLLVPFLRLPMLATCGLALLLQWRLDGGRPVAERLWSPAAFLALALVATIHFALVTRGTGDLVGWDLLGTAYDSLADHLLAGNAQVDRYAIKWEVFDVDGRANMYFGPLPALLRIPAHWIDPTGYGHWSRLSCWTAALLAVVAAVLILRAPLRSNRWLTPSTRRGVLALSLLAFGLGTPVAFAMSAAAIYHEAPLWGLATALFGVHFALGLARSRARPGPPVVGLAIAAGAALLARVTFALPLYALLGAFALALLSDALPGGAARIRATLARLVLWTSPALGLLAFQLWLNHDRFGAVTTFIDFRHLAYLAGDPRSWGILQQTGSFDLGRVPTALVNYFGVRPEALLGRFPFVAMTSPSYLAPDLYPSIFREKVASLSVVSTWLVAGALVGCASLLRRDASWLLRVVVVALFGQTLLVLAYYIVSHRYALDFLPFLWAGYACFVGGFGRRCGARAASGLLAVAVATSVLATLCAVISWIPQSRRFTPPSYKVHVLETIGDVSAFLAGSPEP